MSATAQRAERAPRLVLRFAVLTALCLGLAGAAILGFTRHVQVRQAEATAARHAGFVADSLLGAELRPADVTAAVTGSRRTQLDQLFSRRILRAGIVAIAVAGPDGVITYATDHALIGRPIAKNEVRAEVSAGTARSDVTSVAGSDARRVKVLRSYVPFTVRGSTAGVAVVYQDYGRIAQAATDAFVPVAAILELVMLVLLVLLVPLLARASSRIARQIRTIRHQATHDELTGLPNRVLFGERIADALTTDGAAAGAAVLLLDVDRFHEVNDTLGHERGDELLGAVGARLAATAGGDATCARLGGDEFGLVVPGVDGDQARSVAQALIQSLSEPFALGGVTFAVDASIGIAVSDEDGDEPGLLLRRAGMALDAAKSRRTAVERYEPSLDTYDPGRLTLMTELRRGLEQGEIVPYYQLKADLRTGAYTGAEVLARWQHPERGLLPPGAFVPLAERTGVGRTLTSRMLGAAVSQLGEWRSSGLELTLAVNLTMFDLLDPALPDEIAALLEAERVPAGSLELEITESAIMSDPIRVREVLERLSALGAKLAIDDFGTGYSSLGYLTSLPVDAVKIDKSFVLGMADDEGNRVIVRSTVDLGHNLGLLVVAEGVETTQAWESLRAYGCDLAQGYLVARPEPVGAVEQLLAAKRSARPAA